MLAPICYWEPAFSYRPVVLMCISRNSMSFGKVFLGKMSLLCIGLIFHSDRGSQYGSKAYRSMLRHYQIVPSMSAPGCPYDNSPVESFFATLKRELIYRKKYDTIEEVRTDTFRYIELFYNRKRLHSSLRYLCPVQYRLAQNSR